MPSPTIPVRDQQSREADDVKWYAGLAMQAIITQHGIPDSPTVREEIALWSWRMGQAMVETDHRLHASES